MSGNLILASICRAGRSIPVAALGLAPFIAASARAQTASAFLDPPPITTERYVEDYSYLRDPDNRTGAWWEPLKFIPLTSSGWAFMGVGDEARLRFEHYTNNTFGSGVKPTESYLRFRAMPYLELRFGDRVRAFGELMAAYGNRSTLTKNPFVDQTGVDVLQAHVAARFGKLTIGGGRLVLIYGSGRLINAGPNIRSSYQGGLVVWRSGRWDIESFYARPVLSGFRSFDNEAAGDEKVWSVYATRNPPKAASGVGLDILYVGFENKTATYNQGAGHEVRHTFGLRHFGTRGGWQFDSEAHLQLGTFEDGDIRAWSAGTILRYTFANATRRPFVEGRLTFVSGDHDRADRALGTFNAINPAGGYFGENGVIGPANLINVRTIVGFDLAPGWTLSGAGVLYGRASLGDGLYGLGREVIRRDMGSRARFVGAQADASIAWAVNRHLGFNLAYSILVPGQFIHDTGPAETIHFVGAQVQFKF